MIVGDLQQQNPFNKVQTIFSNSPVAPLTTPVNISPLNNPIIQSMVNNQPTLATQNINPESIQIPHDINIHQYREYIKLLKDRKNDIESKDIDATLKQGLLNSLEEKAKELYNIKLNF